MHIGHVKVTRHWLTVLVAALVATVNALLWPPERLPSPLLSSLHELEWIGYDALFVARGPRPDRVSPKIVVVGYDENTEKNLQHDWPPPRRMHARAIDNLVADGARLIVYDVAFTDASTPADDRALDAALARAKRVVLACHITRGVTEQSKTLAAPYSDPTLNIDFQRDAADGGPATTIGFAEVSVDLGGVVRRFTPVTSFQDQWMPSMAAAAYLAATGKKPDDIAVTPDAVRLGDLRIPRTGPTAEDAVDHTAIPSTYLDYPTGARGFPQLPLIDFYQVYSHTFSPGIFKDKIVYIGVAGAEVTKREGDHYTIASSHLQPEQVGGCVTSDVPGVVLQAHILNALFTRGFIASAPWWLLWGIIFLFTLLGILLARHFINWRGPVLLFAVMLGYTVVAFLLFSTWQLHIPWVIPDLLIAISALSLAWTERGALRKKWAGYVSPAVLEVILRQEAEVGARRVEASVIFGDIRNFTGFSEAHSPETVVRLLNKHYEKMTNLIYREGGTIDKFLGDGILIVFGAPLPMEGAAVRAVRASWRMREAALEPIIDTDGAVHTLATGFGITTGPFVAGHVGSHQRHEFTVIGDTVNLASRLQGVTGKPDVIIDTNTLAQVRDYVDVEPLGEVTLKGKSQPVPCFKVIAWHDTPKTT